MKMGRMEERRARARVSLWTILLMVLTSCTPGQGPGDPVAKVLEPGDHELTLRVGGRSRRYLVRIPRTVPASRLPTVLVAFHGGGGNPEQFRETAGLDELAEREGLLVVYPAGSAVLRNGLLTWNAGPGCCGFARDQNIDDVQFTLAVLDDLKERHPFDTARVFLTGHSNGSMMAYRVAGEAPEGIAGAVGVAGTMQVPTVAPTQAVPLLHIHSKDDPRAFYEGGIRGDRSHPPASAMLERWASTNGCASEPQEKDRRLGEAHGPDAGHTALHLEWACSEAPLEHWQLSGPGHSWPGRRASRTWEAIVGPSTEVISAAEEIWRFISALGA